LALLATLLWVGTGQAVTLGFENISANLVGDAVIGEAQLTVDVTDAGGGQVLFTLNNAGPQASSITDVYFDDGGLLLGIASIDNSDPGVSFSELATPPSLPAANQATPPFQATAGLSANSDPPVQPNGVNPGESLGIVLDLLGGQTFADAVAALNDGSLRIGIHVQGFASGGSESFVGVPEPHAAILFGVGALLVTAGIRRRSSLG
jgi:hypothetical protein